METLRYQMRLKPTELLLFSKINSIPTKMRVFLILSMHIFGKGSHSKARHSSLTSDSFSKLFCEVMETFFHGSVFEGDNNRCEISAFIEILVGSYWGVDINWINFTRPELNQYQTAVSEIGANKRFQRLWQSSVIFQKRLNRMKMCKSVNNIEILLSKDLMIKLAGLSWQQTSTTMYNADKTTLSSWDGLKMSPDCSHDQHEGYSWQCLWVKKFIS